MMQFVIVITVFVALWGLVLSVPQKDSRVISHRIKTKGHKGLGITGGTVTDIKKHPYQAAVILSTYDFFLGSGVIVGKRFILVSAQQVYRYAAVDLVVRVGSSDISQGGQKIPIKQIIVHSKYDQHFDFDVALLELAKPIKYSKTAKPIKLATKQVRNGTTATLTGFGPSSWTGSERNFLQGKLQLLDRNACQPHYIYKFDQSTICAYNSKVCACNYDYGDPLVFQNKLIAIFIGGSFCCTDTNPQVFCSVPGIQKWVKKQMNRRGFNQKEDELHYFKESI